MAKVIKTFQGVPAGEIYPKEFVEGDECPAELEDAAKELNALEGFEKKPAKAEK